MLLCITGVIYPLLITGLAQGMFPYQANGSQIVINGKVVGSELIGQPFNGTQYFWGRLSATPDFPYNANNSAGSNLGPDDPSLNASIQARIDALHAVDPTNNATIPEDLVTSSASGLDPDISVAAALYQVGRIARERNLTVSNVTALVNKYTETFSILNLWRSHGQCIGIKLGS